MIIKKILNIKHKYYQKINRWNNLTKIIMEKTSCIEQQYRDFDFFGLKNEYAYTILNILLSYIILDHTLILDGIHYPYKTIEHKIYNFIDLVLSYFNDINMVYTEIKKLEKEHSWLSYKNVTKTNQDSYNRYQINLGNIKSRMFKELDFNYLMHDDWFPALDSDLLPELKSDSVPYFNVTH